MDDQILMDSNVPVNLKFMPAQIELLVRAIHELPYRVAQPLITSITSQCREQSAKPEEKSKPKKIKDEPAKP